MVPGNDTGVWRHLQSGPSMAQEFEAIFSHGKAVSSNGTEVPLMPLVLKLSPLVGPTIKAAPRSDTVIEQQSPVVT
jgi:hypothetical protein